MNGEGNKNSECMTCPVCGRGLVITRIEDCRECETETAQVSRFIMLIRVGKGGMRLLSFCGAF